MKKRIAPARAAALTVLEAVAAGGYASDLLRESTRNLSARDAGLAGQIVLGSLRVQNQLDYLIEKYSGRVAASLDLPVQMALRIAIFQLRYLERIPPHAAVDDSVEFVKKHQRAASGLVNAVLRKVTREEITWPNEALAHACPEWLLGKWIDQFGLEQARSIADTALREPGRFIRIREGESVPAGLDASPTSVAGCYQLGSSDDAEVRLHDISSQTIVPLLDLKPEHSYLDLCAAPGNKTAQAMESKPALVVACDISQRRLETVSATICKVVLDATEQLPFGRKFDRILIDAPCSGTGTLSRNPEIKWRLQKNELVRQHARQLNILKRAVEVLEPKGVILYATCSLEREENADVLREALSATKLRCRKEVSRIPGRDLGDGFYAAVLTVD